MNRTDFHRNYFHRIAPAVLISAAFAGILNGCVSTAAVHPTRDYAATQRIPRTKLYTRAYADELRRLASTAKPGPGETDASFAYSPAVLRNIKPVEVKRHVRGSLYITGEIVIKLREGHTDENLLEQLKRNGIESRLVGYVPAFRMVQVRLNDDSKMTLDRIRRLPGVKFLTRHKVRSIRQAPTGTAGLPYVNKHVWQVIDFRVHSVWPRSNGRGVRVAVLDSGLDTTTGEFKGRLAAPYSVITRSAKFQDGVLTTDGKPLRVVDHGTAVAAVIGGKTPGVAPGVRIMPIQVLGFHVLQGRIVTHDMAILEGLARAIEYKAHIINLSLGDDFSDVLEAVGPDRKQVRAIFIRKMRNAAGRNMAIFDEAFRACATRGIPVVVSAGNENVPADAQPLARHAYTIGVGAVDREGRRAAFSNYGPVVDTFAPGDDIASKGAGNQYQPYSGTSFSAPYVTGLLALARGLKLKAGPTHLRRALRASNEPVKVSILPGKSVPVIAPIAFLNRLGAKLPAPPPGRLQQAFQKKYGAYTVQPTDSPLGEINKILDYLNKRSEMYFQWPEAARLQRLAQDNFEAAYKVFAEDSFLDARGYFLMIVMKRVQLSRARLARLSGIRFKSDGKPENFNWDYMSELFRAKNYTQALEWMYRRLKARWYNPATLDAVAELGGKQAFPELRFRLKELQAAPAHQGGASLGPGRLFSDMQVLTLAALVRSAGDDPQLRREAHRLAGISYERYRNRRPFTVIIRGGVVSMDGRADTDWFSNYMQALIRFSRVYLEFGDRRFLSIVVETLEQIEGRRGTSVKTVYWYKQAQSLLNAHTDFGFKFNYQDPESRRRAILNKFKTASKTAVFREGKFRR